MIKIPYGATKKTNAKILRHFVLWLITSLCFNTAIHAGGKETVTYYHHDALGSVVAATNEQGQVIWREEYKPFGARIVKDATSQKHRVWYTGHTEEQVLGLIYMGARWFHAEIGQFLSIDPVGFKEENPQSFNRYAYANQNPYKFVDPDGREPGDPFKTDLEAHVDALKYINPTSIKQNREYSGVVYQGADKNFYASEPVKQQKGESKETVYYLPKGAKLTGDYHTHGDYTKIAGQDNKSNNKFSERDKTGIKEAARSIPGYRGSVGTPGGDFLHYQPSTMKNPEKISGK